MLKHCKECHRETPAENYICEHCGAELIDNAQLMAALSLAEHKDTSPSYIRRKIAPVVLVSLSGILAASLQSTSMIYIGLLASAVLYFKSRP